MQSGRPSKRTREGHKVAGRSRRRRLRERERRRRGCHSRRSRKPTAGKGGSLVERKRRGETAPWAQVGRRWRPASGTAGASELPHGVGNLVDANADAHAKAAIRRGCVPGRCIEGHAAANATADESHKLAGASETLIRAH